MFSKSPKEVQSMTLEAAYDYARDLVEMETRGTGDTEDALARIEQRYGIGTNQLLHLRARRAKSCDLSLFVRMKLAYYDLCERQIRKVQHSIAVEKAKGSDVNFEDLGAEAEVLASKIAARKASLRDLK